MPDAQARGLGRHTTGALITVMTLLWPATVETRSPPIDHFETESQAERPPTSEANHESTAVQRPSDAGALGLEFAAGLLGEAWNLNDRRETLVDGSAGVWWTFVSRTSLLVEFHATRVFQNSSRDAFVNGLTTVVRWHALPRDRWTLFVDVGPGISWSDTRVPPRGTAFNYLALAGSGVLARLGRQSHVLAGFRWLHLSNNGREGRGRNPDIEALGGYAGLLVVF